MTKEKKETAVSEQEKINALINANDKPGSFIYQDGELIPNENDKSKKENKIDRG